MATQAQQDFFNTVTNQQTDSNEWWNGVAAALNGIALSMEYEWLDNKGCPLQNHFNESSEPGVRAAILQDELYPHLKTTQLDASYYLYYILSKFEEYKGGAPYENYAQDLSSVQSAMSRLYSDVPQLHERRINDTKNWMDEGFEQFPTKKGYELNA